MHKDSNQTKIEPNIIWHLEIRHLTLGNLMLIKKFDIACLGQLEA